PSKTPAIDRGTTLPPLRHNPPAPDRGNSAPPQGSGTAPPPPPRPFPPSPRNNPHHRTDRALPHAPKPAIQSAAPPPRARRLQKTAPPLLQDAARNIGSPASCRTRPRPAPHPRARPSSPPRHAQQLPPPRF